MKPGCVEDYLELARATDAAVENSEPGMLHHTFDQDPDDPQAFVWSEVYANDAAFEAHVTNPPVQEYLQKHAELGDGFSVEVMEPLAASASINGILRAAAQNFQDKAWLQQSCLKRRDHCGSAAPAEALRFRLWATR